MIYKFLKEGKENELKEWPKRFFRIALDAEDDELIDESLNLQSYLISLIESMDDWCAQNSSKDEQVQYYLKIKREWGIQDLIASFELNSSNTS